MQNNIYINKILNLPGQEDTKKIVMQWNQAAKNLSQINTSPNFIIPNLLLITKIGAGKTHLIRLLSDYLDSVRLLDFYGDVKYFEYTLDYCYPNENLDEIYRLSDLINSAAGFRHQYRGILSINISAWHESFLEPHFTSILRYLLSISTDVLLIFVVENIPDIELKIIEKILHANFRIKHLNLPYPSSIEFSAYCSKKLSESGLIINDDSLSLLTETIDVIKQGKYFNGFKTINRMCQDIAFEVYSSQDFSFGPLTKERLKQFDKNSEYAKKLSEIVTTRSIGFVEGGKDEHR